MATFDSWAVKLDARLGDEPKAMTAAQTGTVGGMGVTANNVIPGYNEPKPGDFQTWQEVGKFPTFAMALGALIGPIEAATISTDADEDAPDGAKDFIDKEFGDLKANLVRDCNHACIDGYAAFEKVFAVRKVLGIDRLTYHKLKWLWSDAAVTKVLLDRSTGGFAGIRQRRQGEPVTLPPEKSFVWTVNKKGDNFYGTGFAELAEPWVGFSGEEFRRSGQYSSKVSGIIPSIKYPPGKTRNPITGEEVENYKIAQQILDSLAGGNGVAIPNMVNALVAKDPRAAAAMSGESLWVIEFMDAGTDQSQGHGNRLSQLDKMVCRAVYQPERRIIEATLAGSRADSGTADDLGLLMSQLIWNRMVGEWNKYLVNPLLLYNFGESAVNTVRLKAGQIIDENKAYLRDIAKSLTTNAALRPDLIDAIDIEQLSKATGIPVTDFVVNGQRMTDSSLRRAELIVNEPPVDPSEQAA